MREWNWKEFGQMFRVMARLYPDLGQHDGIAVELLSGGREYVVNKASQISRRCSVRCFLQHGAGISGQSGRAREQDGPRPPIERRLRGALA